jgi:hypothetical protein
MSPEALLKNRGMLSGKLQGYMMGQLREDGGLGEVGYRPFCFFNGNAPSYNFDDVTVPFCRVGVRQAAKQ